MAMTATLAMALAACGGGQAPEAEGAAADAAETPDATATEAPDAPATGEAATTDVASADFKVEPNPEKPASFMLCASCHKVEAGQHGIGPSLAGVFEARAGHAEGFNYSAQLKDSGLTWDAQTLDKWLQGPQKMVPGSRMVMVIPQPEKRQEIINYLASLK
jgi:cytochrome c